MIANVSRMAGSLSETVERAGRSMGGGGTLSIRIAPHELDAEGLTTDPSVLARWLRARGYRIQSARLVVGADGSAADLLVTARVCRARLMDVVNESFQTLSPNCASVREAIASWHLSQAPDL